MVNHSGVETECFSHVSDGAAGAVGNYCCRYGGALAAVFFVNILNDFFSSLMFKIHINIWRLFAFFGNKALKKYIDLPRPNFGDAETVTDHRIGSGSAPLAENILTTGVLHNVINRQEKIFILFFFNQL